MLYKVIQGYTRLYRRLYSVAAIEPSNPSERSNYQPTIVALPRVIAAKLHSIDVERIVSSYTLIKSTDRSSLSLQDYLVVRHNMASIANFDVRPAVEEWMRRRERRP